jgi:tetratricopeptide (TPR) repeat protein
MPMKIYDERADGVGKSKAPEMYHDDCSLRRFSFVRPVMVSGAIALMSVLVGCSHSSSTASPTVSANDSASAVAGPPASAASLEASAVNCMRNNDLPCAETNWSGYVKLRPMDTEGIANLGFVLNKEDKNEQAITMFEKDISMGAGAYDLFAFYSDSLAKVGRTDDAIDWSYKTLKLEPSLVDVREKLAQLLVLKKRNYEALTLLSEFDQYLDEHGQQPYFLGNRMAIESAMRDLGTDKSQENGGLRLVKFSDAFYAPVSVGESGVRAFVVDTGATSVVINNDFIAASKVPYTTVRAHVVARLADGREVDAKEVLIDRLMVGPIELDKVKAMSCETCSLLLGANALSSFTMNITQVKGVDVATLTPHRSSQ